MPGALSLHPRVGAVFGGGGQPRLPRWGTRLLLSAVQTRGVSVELISLEVVSHSHQASPASRTCARPLQRPQ